MTEDNTTEALYASVPQALQQQSIRLATACGPSINDNIGFRGHKHCLGASLRRDGFRLSLIAAIVRDADGHILHGEVWPRINPGGSSAKFACQLSQHPNSGCVTTEKGLLNQPCHNSGPVRLILFGHSVQFKGISKVFSNGSVHELLCQLFHSLLGSFGLSRGDTGLPSALHRFLTGLELPSFPLLIGQNVSWHFTTFLSFSGWRSQMKQTSFWPASASIISWAYRFGPVMRQGMSHPAISVVARFFFSKISGSRTWPMI